METVEVAPHITALVTPVPVPGLGFLPVNAFVIASSGSPILVDTCVTQPAGEFVAGVSSVVDPADIRWIWLTHADRDHTGALQEMLAAAPRATVITNFISVGHLMTGPEPLPLDRVHVVNTGERVDIGDRELVAFRPPLFDNPGTVGFFDPAGRILVSSDCFGAPMATLEDTLVPDVAAIPDDQRIAGQLVWGSADSPWVHSVDESKFAASLDSVRAFDPSLVLSTHVPAIHGDLERHLDTLAKLPGSTPWVGPDQAALQAMLAELEPAGA
jgi:glyoxylase-like metal-dependent hydrolase (beta-lactamase superfamily II)